MTGKNKINKQMLSPDAGPEDDFFYEANMTSCATECTGLIPTPPMDEEEAESYTDLYAVPRPSKENMNFHCAEQKTKR